MKIDVRHAVIIYPPVYQNIICLTALGILNILSRYKELYGAEPDAVFSGFHMRKKEGYTEEDVKTIKEIAWELTKWNTKFFTGHCTGEEPYRMMKEIMGEQLVYVHSGDEVEI